MDSAALEEDSSSASVNPAEDAALRLTARAEQCSPLLLRKLLQKGFSTREAQAAVEKLESLGLVDDSRFCELWLRFRLRSKSTTPRRLLSALRAKGIDTDTALDALRECMDDEAERGLLEHYLKRHSDAGRAELRFEGFSQEVLTAAPDEC